jgi:soluble lytic murein transglycosylase-like protein
MAKKKSPFAGTFWLLSGLSLLTSLMLCPPSLADIYKFVDARGRVHFSDRPLGSGYRLVLRSRKGWKPHQAPYRTRNIERFRPVIQQAAQHFQVDPALVHAVIAAESGYDPDAVSSAGAVGLMQLMPDTARRYGARDRRNPLQNVHAGVAYLKDLLQQFQALDLALAAYNAGENAVARYGNRIPPYRETQTYVQRVLANYRRLRSTS